MRWPGVGEAFRIAGVGGVEHLFPLFDYISVVQHLRSQQGNPAVMFVVVPSKERVAKGTRVFDGAEALGDGLRISSPPKTRVALLYVCCQIGIRSAVETAQS